MSKNNLNNGVKLTSDISGGLGSHEKDTILHNLPPQTRDMLIQSGVAEAIESTTRTDVVDAAAAISTPLVSADTAAEGAADNG